MSRRTFTFAEALTALLVVAVLLPVTLQGVRVAARASQMAMRRETAVRLASLKLTELVLTGDWQDDAGTGDFEDQPGYDWEFTTADWPEDDDGSTAMTEIAVAVLFTVQGRTFDAQTSTLMAETE